MHELSIAQALIDAACEAAGPARVTRVMIRVGELAGVVAEALQFSFEVAAVGTACEGAELQIEPVPLAIHCPACDAMHTSLEPYRLTCPACGTTGTIVAGRELDLIEIELVDHDPSRYEPTHCDAKHCHSAHC